MTNRAPSADELRHLSVSSSLILPHRSLYFVKCKPIDFLVIFLLTVVFNLALWVFSPQILAFWKSMLQFWDHALELGAPVLTSSTTLGDQVFDIPYLQMTASIPDSATLYWNAAIVALLFALSFLVPSSYLPLTYLFRTVLVIHSSAIVFFMLSPNAFPYDLPSYLKDSLLLSLIFLFAIPWVLALVYYILPAPLLHKIGFTFLILSYFAVALPLQHLAHAYLIHRFSLLYLPELYFLFGVTIDALLLITFYSIAVSLEWDMKSA